MTTLQIGLKKVHDDVKALNVKLTTGELQYIMNIASEKEFFADRILINSKADKNVKSSKTRPWVHILSFSCSFRQKMFKTIV